MLLSLLLMCIMTLLYMCLIKYLHPHTSNRGFVGAILWGAASFVLAFLIENLLLHSGLMGTGFMSTIGAPIVEEILKALPLLLFFHGSRKHDATGIAMGFVVGVGFALPESIFYVAQNPDFALATATGRILSTHLVHGFTTGLVGFLLAWLPARYRVQIGLISAGLFHGGYNLMVVSLHRDVLVLAAAKVGVISLAVLLILLVRVATPPRVTATS